MTDDNEQDAKDLEIARLSGRLGEALAREAKQRLVNQDLERQNRQLGEFTQMVSHDLRAPLRHVISLVGFLREDVDGSLPEVVDGRLTQVEERAQSMIGLVDDLLDYARAGTETGDRAAIDLQTLVAQAVRLIDDTDGIDVSVVCDLGMVTTDATPLSICLRNLVDNAVKHHPGPTGAVTIEARRDDNALLFTVTDDGAGIDPIHHDRIFEPMQSLDGGTGLGLSTIARILSERGGSISLDSQIGQGATFTIMWPLQAQPVLDLASTPPSLVTITTAASAPRVADDQAE